MSERIKDYRSDDPDHFVKAIVEGFSGDDRTIAIMAAALIDETLERALRFYLTGCTIIETKSDGQVISRDHKVASALFGALGSLSTFSSKIDMSRALGIIGETAYSDLKIIKDIRNKFAHHWLMEDAKGKLSGVSFKTRKIVGWCGSLKGWRAINEDGPKKARDKFRYTCLSITMSLWHYVTHNAAPKLPAPIIP
jgi:hypothetical protein